MSKVVLITGASAGIGQATADHLASKGWTVIGASRRGTGSGTWSGLVMDVDDDESVRAGVAQVVSQHGRLDAVVACAGWGLAGSVEQTPISDARAQLETNFFGAVRTVREALGPMRRAGAGRIVLVSSLGPNPYEAAVKKAVGLMERDEQSGAPPSSVASAIAKVLEAKRPPRRVSVGKFDERAGAFAKRLLPYRIFEAAAKSSLGV